MRGNRIRFVVFISALAALGCQQQTALEDVPAWAKRAVWYQIFPERFCNGDPANDPTLNDIKGSWPHDLSAPYRISDWTGDWYALQPWERADKDFYWHVQRRRYGGDLQGVLDKLDYLQELGITAIYFNPLFESPSLHKYDATTYHHIDTNFGPDPDGDWAIIADEVPDDPATWRWTSADSLFLRLISECHNREIRVIIDGVFNHVGLTFWAFRDVQEKQLNSKYASWFTITSWDNPHTSENEFDYAGWGGSRELPEIFETEDGYLPETKRYIFYAVHRWMDPNGDGDPADGIDGWRLDTGEKVPMAFWREFRSVVRSINPEAYLVGEVWWQDWQNNKMFDASPWLQGDVFDAVMNYRWAKEVIHFFVDQDNKISATKFADHLQDLREDYRQDVNYVLMNLLDSHDTDRIASQVVNIDDDYDHRDNPKENPDYSVRKPNASEIQTQKLMALFQITYVGAPMIYYGDEAGMWGADDPDCRKPMLWPDKTYQPERSHPFGKSRPVDEVAFNGDLFDYYKTLIKIRQGNPALQTGEYRTVLTADDKDVFVFERFDAKKRARLIIVINNSERQQDVRLSLKQLHFKQAWQDILTQQSYAVKRGFMPLSVPAKSGMILR